MNRFLLAAIALGLWANDATVFIQPAHADTDYYLTSALDSVARKLSSIDTTLSMGSVNVHCDNCH